MAQTFERETGQNLDPSLKAWTLRTPDLTEFLSQNKTELLEKVRAGTRGDHSVRGKGHPAPRAASLCPCPICRAQLE